MDSDVSMSGAWDKLQGIWIKAGDAPDSNTPAGAPDPADTQTGSHPPDQRLEGARLWLRYCDSAGRTTERYVNRCSLERAEYGGYLHAFCELRQDWRSFLISRIIEISDPHGEVHDPENFLENFLPPRMRRKQGPHERSPFGRALILVDSVGDMARILAFAAEADARFLPKELAVITGVAADFAIRTGLYVTKTDLENFGRWVKLLRPSPLEAKVACDRLAASKQFTARDIAELVDIIITVDNKVTADERIAVDTLKAAVKESFSPADNHPSM